MSQPSPYQTRRQFLQLAAGIAVTLTAGRMAHADALPPLAESDPTAAALGYKEDASKADTAKFPKYQPGQTCAKCNFFQGTDARGPCTLYPGKTVTAKGWCSAFAAKP